MMQVLIKPGKKPSVSCQYLNYGQTEDTESERVSDRARERGGERERGREREREREREWERERELELENVFYKDYSLGSVKNLSNN